MQNTFVKQHNKFNLPAKLFLKHRAMKKIYLITFIFFACAMCYIAQPAKKAVHSTTKTKKKLEDQVRQYFFVMLTKGENSREPGFSHCRRNTSRPYGQYQQIVQ